MFRLKKYISPYLGYMVLTLLIKLLGTVVLYECVGWFEAEQFSRAGALCWP